jgi:hypothetical protein
MPNGMLVLSEGVGEWWGGTVPVAGSERRGLFSLASSFRRGIMLFLRIRVSWARSLPGLCDVLIALPR